MLIALKTLTILVSLRAAMVDEGLDAYIIPLSDAHQGSRIEACDERLKYVSKFTGSNGVAAVTANGAFLWTDGRYFTQAEEELDENWTLMKMGLPDTPSLGEHFAQTLPKNSKVGVDPSLFSKSDWETTQRELSVNEIVLQEVTTNLIDKIWDGRPACNNNQVKRLNDEFTGETIDQKLTAIRDQMKDEEASILLLTELDDIAWTFNLRGSDLPSSSVFKSYAIITETSFYFFVAENKLPSEVIQDLESKGGEILPYADIRAKLEELVGQIPDGKIWFGSKCNYALQSNVPVDRALIKLVPTQMLKAVKNPVEEQGMKNALIRDAAALSRFYTWLHKEMAEGREVTEVGAADKIVEFRSQHEYYQDTSFPTISAAGPNGAIIHYRPTPESNAVITNSMYLVDTGALYLDGTTDITRTFHFGTPSDFEKEAYTRVLKGQIAIATAHFPMKTVASRIDSFARSALWEYGLDYQHGTGHGIGHYLNVHEGPSYIRYDHVPDDQGLQPHMFTSNEPGYYEPHEFGIRLENIVQVVNVTLEHNFADLGFLGIEDLTFLPYEHKLMKFDLLTNEEIQYLNSYQEKVRSITAPFVRDEYQDEEAYNWIMENTQPIPLPSSS